MMCDWLIPCRAVVADESGGISVIGIFVRLTAGRLPTTADPIAVAFRLSGEPHEQCQWQVIVTDPNGNDLNKTVQSTVTLSAYGFIDAHVPFPPLPIRMVGVHTITLLLDGKAARTIALPVQRVM